MKPILKHNFFKQNLYYGSYNLLLMICHLVLVSLIAFFHFLLDHGLGVIEEWIFDNGWNVIVISKLIALTITLKFINIKIDDRHPIRNLIRKGMAWPKMEILVMVFVLMGFSIWLGKPKATIDPEIEVLKILTSYFGIILFYMSDLILLNALQEVFPVYKWGTRVKLLLFPLILFLVSKSTFLYERNLNYMLFFHFFFCLFLSRWGEKNWTFSFAYLALLVAPAGAIMGLDPIWGSHYSILRMTSEINAPVYLSLGLMVLVYLNYQSKAERIAKV